MSRRAQRVLLLVLVAVIFVLFVLGVSLAGLPGWLSTPLLWVGWAASIVTMHLISRRRRAERR